MNREAWRAVIHRVAKSRTPLSDWTELKLFIFPRQFHYWKLGLALQGCCDNLKHNEVPDVMLTWTRSPAQQGDRQGQCLSNFRCSRWMMKLILYIVIIILSFIWSRIELASQKISEYRAIVMLFCDIFVSLYVHVCMCVCGIHPWVPEVITDLDSNSYPGPLFKASSVSCNIGPWVSGL